MVPNETGAWRAKVRHAPLSVLLVLPVLPACRSQPPIPHHVEVRIVAEDTSWSAAYMPDEVPTGREIHAPVGADVSLTLTSRRYVALFSAPSLALRDFASPGLPGTFHFHADAPGSYDIRADELCGLPHDEKSRGRIVVEEGGEFRSWFAALEAAR